MTSPTAQQKRMQLLTSASDLAVAVVEGRPLSALPWRAPRTPRSRNATVREQVAELHRGWSVRSPARKQLFPSPSINAMAPPTVVAAPLPVRPRSLTSSSWRPQQGAPETPDLAPLDRARP